MYHNFRNQDQKRTFYDFLIKTSQVVWGKTPNCGQSIDQESLSTKNASMMHSKRNVLITDQQTVS